MAKLKIFPYDKRFPKLFQKVKDRILHVLGDCEIHHIGSTAVPGLGGKGIIDTLIALDDWEGEEDVVKKLKKLGYKHVHPKEKGRVFLSKVGPTKFGDIHLHLVKKGSRAYKERLVFRNYLRTHPKEAEGYFKLKLKWLKQDKNNREKYGLLKENYMRQILTNLKDS